MYRNLVPVMAIFGVALLLNCEPYDTEPDTELYGTWRLVSMNSTHTLDSIRFDLDSSTLHEIALTDSDYTIRFEENTIVLNGSYALDYYRISSVGDTSATNTASFNTLEKRIDYGFAGGYNDQELSLSLSEEGLFVFNFVDQDPEARGLRRDVDYTIQGDSLILTGRNGVGYRSSPLRITKSVNTTSTWRRE